MSTGSIENDFDWVDSFEKYVVPDGMPLSVFNDRYARSHGDELQGFTDRAMEMAIGNLSLDREHVTQEEIDDFVKYCAAGITPMSGRHLQHGDKTQIDRNIEVFTNCSTAAFSFLNFYLLLNGSGVGRDYSSESCRVDWEYTPNVRVVLDGGLDDDGDINKGAHPDFASAFDEFHAGFDSLREAKHKYDSNSEDVRWFKVRDSREGWAEVVAVLETAAFHRNNKDSLFIFDFSDVRPKGSKINGMQNRPAQGPIPLMRAVLRLMTIKGAKMKPWKQALFIDHYLAATVVMGDVRRAARMATKSWRDRDVIEFIDVKRGGFLWSANNSILVDDQFWLEAADPRPSHGRRVFEAAVGAAYYDETGEPGFINSHKLYDDTDGFEDITAENLINKDYDLRLHPKTYEMIEKTLKVLKKSDQPFITNPCQPGWAPVLTPDGIRTIDDIQEGSIIWSGSSWTKVNKKWSTGIKEVYRYRTTSGVFYGTENHRIVQNGQKIEIKDADSIDIAYGSLDYLAFVPDAIIDGLMIGDGSRHLTSAKKVYLDIGNSSQEFEYQNSEISHLIGEPHPAKYDRARVVSTSVVPEELPPLYERSIPDRYFYANAATMASFLRGLYSANGSCNGSRVCLKTSSSKLVEQVQQMLSALGIVSYFTTNKPTTNTWDNGEYTSRESYDININRHNAEIFARKIGFIQSHKTEALEQLLTKNAGTQKTSFDIISKELVSTEEVFDINVECDEHVYWTGGILSSNCGEIVLSKFGGYCVIGDVVLSRCNSKDIAKRAVELTARALIRTNTMKALYQAEVNRTNRIGVGLTGIFEYAWKHFKLSFCDLIGVYDYVFESADKVDGNAMEFWEHIADLRDTVMSSSSCYSELIGANKPHTFTTIKPSGTISKVMACTEGAHLPPYLYYVRWVICKKDSDKHADYVKRGYPIKDVSHQYHGCVVVGFPTKHPITDVVDGDKLLTASDVTVDEQFKWVKLIEHFWFGEGNNQVSYTLKYDQAKVSHDEYSAMILKWQPHVKCCSVMPFTDTSAYAYLPEEKIDEAKYNELMTNIDRAKEEDYDESAIECEGGACPVEEKIR